MKIFINPGHHPGVDPGACGNNLREADIALRVGKRVKGYLEAVGYEVKLLQTDNLAGESPEYENVTGTANNWQAAAFVSIHCNSSANDSARGAETLCYSLSGEGGRLANCLQSQLIPSIKEIDPDFPDRGVKQDVRGLAVLRATSMPAALVELAFISNEVDASLLVDYEDEFARALARGVTDYFI